MPTMNLKHSHKIVKDYCSALVGFVWLGVLGAKNNDDDLAIEIEQKLAAEFRLSVWT